MNVEIREESPDELESCAFAKPFGLWIDHLRHSWHDTREGAMYAAIEYLEVERQRVRKLEVEYGLAEDELAELHNAVASLQATEHTTSEQKARGDTFDRLMP